MKIAFFAPAWPYGPNGIISYLRTVTEALHRLGHEIFVLTFNQDGRLGYEHVVQLSLPRRHFLERLRRRILPPAGIEPVDWQGTAEVLAACVRDLRRQYAIDVFEMEESFGWCGLVAQGSDVPVVVRLHGPYFLNGVYDSRVGDELKPLQLEREGFGIRCAAAVTSPSRQVLDATLAYYHLETEASVIPNPVSPASADLAWSYASCEPHTLLFVGRTDRRKGGDLVLRTFEKLLENSPDLVLHFVGPDCGFADAAPGTSWNEYLQTHLSAKAQSRIIYHGMLAPPEIIRLRRLCHVTLMFSRYENFPMVCMEALTIGCPLVATNVGGIPEIVFHEKTGLLADPENVDDLVAKVATLIDDPELCARLGAAGREACERVFGPLTVAADTIRVYERAIERRRGS